MAFLHTQQAQELFPLSKQAQRREAQVIGLEFICENSNVKTVSQSANKCCDCRHDSYSQTVSSNPPPAFVKVVEEIYVTCGGAHPYYQCLATGGNTFPELRDNIQRYVAAAAVNYNQGNFSYRPPGSGSLPSNTIANPKGELKAITTRSGIVLDRPFVLILPPFINPKEDERAEETLTDQDLAEYTIKLHINITLADALILITKYQKMLKALLSNKEKLLELENITFNENCSAVILKKLPEKLRDPGKFLILCGFSELKCKALADLGASINLMSLSIWKKLGLPELISIRMTLELANRAIFTPIGIARDVFVPTAHALIDVHGEEMILRDEYEIFYFDIKEKNSGSTTIHADISLSDLECFNFDFKPDLGELTSIVDSGICENVLSATNVNLPPEEDHSPLFAYVVWIFLSFLMYPVVPPNLLSFRNEDTIFDPGITNYHFPSLFPDVSHRCETFIKFNVYQNS
nr:hypothetical protein [Tanacetum cinerariifolium]